MPPAEYPLRAATGGASPRRGALGSLAQPDPLAGGERLGVELRVELLDALDGGAVAARDQGQRVAGLDGVARAPVGAPGVPEPARGALRRPAPRDARVRPRPAAGECARAEHHDEEEEGEDRDGDGG